MGCPGSLRSKGIDKSSIFRIFMGSENIPDVEI